MIRSFGDRGTEDFYEGKRSARARRIPASIAKVARRKLDQLAYAVRLDDLRAPPANRLEALLGKLDGFHSIRINEQWRVVFRWNDGAAEDVRITDYH